MLGIQTSITFHISARSNLKDRNLMSRSIKAEYSSGKYSVFLLTLHDACSRKPTCAYV